MNRFILSKNGHVKSHLLLYQNLHTHIARFNADELPRPCAHMVVLKRGRLVGQVVREDLGPAPAVPRLAVCVGDHRQFALLQVGGGVACAYRNGLR